MPPRIHADIAAKNRAMSAAHRERLKALSPIERVAHQGGLSFAYTDAEAETAARLRECLSKAEILAENLNRSLKARLEEKPFLDELERRTGGIRLPAW